MEGSIVARHFTVIFCQRFEMLSQDGFADNRHTDNNGEAAQLRMGYPCRLHNVDPYTYLVNVLQRV